jgi:hypothetical protein
VVEVAFFKGGFSIDSINHDTPNAKYSGNGPRTLIDHQGGNARFSDKTWLGFNEKVIRIELILTKPEKVKQVMIHALKSQNAWIFLPQKIEVFASTQGSDELILLGTQTINDTIKDLRMEAHALWLDLPQSIETKRVVIKIYPLMEIPKWHPGTGAGSWLFIDEIKLY